MKSTNPMLAELKRLLHQVAALQQREQEDTAEKALEEVGVLPIEVYDQLRKGE